VAKRGEKFVWTEAMGRRLAELRKRAGLTQAELARESGNAGAARRAQFARLERPGKTGASPEFGLVAEYLRACRASVEDIVDLLDGYTGRPTVREARARSAVKRATARVEKPVAKAAQRYDAQTSLARAAKGKPPEPARKRSERALKVAAALRRRAYVRGRLCRALSTEKLGIPATLTVVNLLADFGMKVWAALNRRRADCEAAKQAEIQPAYRQFAKSDALSSEALVYTARVVREIFDDMERNGRLDAVHTDFDIQDKTLQRSRASHRLEREAARVAFNAAMAELASGIWGEAKALCEGVPADSLGKYEAVVRQVCATCYWAAPQSPERRSQLEHFLCDPRSEKIGRDPHLARRVAELAERLFDEREAVLPQHPDTPTEKKDEVVRPEDWQEAKDKVARPKD
jgi:transcriptional regulator with XRE-family HTH domain